VREPGEGAAQGVRVEDLARAVARGRVGLHLRSFPASLDRVKGTPRV
jgi:hypothetical protein